MRCFIGLVPDRHALDALCRCGELIRADDPLWASQKWVARQSLHVTLAFLGDVDPGSVDALAQGLSVAAYARGELSLRFEGLVARPGVSRATMLWAELAHDAGVNDLARGVRRQLGEQGYVFDERPFHPHLTLVRARRASRAPGCLREAFIGSGLGDVAVSDPAVTLFSSELTAQGPIYRAVATWGSPPGSG